MIHSHIILEGPDGAGKTALAKWLASVLGYRYAHEGPPPKGVTALEHYGRLFAEAKGRTVFDRFHLGELVYGPLLRGASGLDRDDVTKLTRLIAGSGTPILFCAPPWETCLANTRQKDELIKDEAVLGQAYDRWLRIVHEHPTNVLHHDYTVAANHGRQLPDGIMQLRRLPDGVIGSPRARLLLIGEQPNDTLDLPFFRRHASSKFLNESLAAAGVHEEDLALTNALDAFGRKRDLMAIIESIRPHRIGLLGKIAAKQFREQVTDWAAQELPHPQFWLRFKHTRLHEYPDMIKALYWS